MTASLTASPARSRVVLFVLGSLIAGFALMGLSNDAVAASPKLTITKKSKSVVQNGSQVVYKITVRNDGTAVSRNTTITDLLPAGLAVNSATSPCTVSGQLVRCAIGKLPVGQSRTYRIYATSLLSNFDTPNDQLTVGKVEQQISMPAGSNRTGTITCPDGGIMADGSFRVDSVDQGTGNLASVDVMALQSVGPDTYYYDLVNNASGQAQVKIFGVCLPHRTTEGHRLISTPRTSVSPPLPAGFYTMNSENCPVGTTPIAPGYWALGPVTLIRSEPNATNGRRFTFKVNAPGQIQVSIRCLSNLTDANGPGDPGTKLQFTSVRKTVRIAPRAIVTERLSCPVGYKGIVAGWNYNKRLVPLGNDPQPINRDFRIWNPTNRSRTATLHLLCIRIRTGDAAATPVKLTNTAFVSSTNAQHPDAVLSASKTITVTP